MQQNVFIKIMTVKSAWFAKLCIALISVNCKIVKLQADSDVHVIYYVPLLHISRSRSSCYSDTDIVLSAINMLPLVMQSSF